VFAGVKVSRDCQLSMSVGVLFWLPQALYFLSHETRNQLMPIQAIVSQGVGNINQDEVDMLVRSMDCGTQLGVGAVIGSNLAGCVVRLAG